MGIIDIKGQKFGRLTVIEHVGSYRGHSTWLCQCDCGKQCVVTGNKLRIGHTRSCGCISSEQTIARNKTYRTHGMKGSRIYKIWENMKGRVFRQGTKDYAAYSKRGICSEWMKFEPFMKWAMENGYNDTLSIDRIDNNGPYAPWNCRWATAAEQGINKSNNIFLEYNGEKLTLSQWERKTGLTHACLSHRVKAGWDVVRILTTPPRNHKYRSLFRRP